MSKFLPDPQIQSLRAMRSGDIAFAIGAPAVQTIGKQSIAFAQPFIQLARSLTTVESVGFPVATPNESPIIGDAFQTILTQNVLESISLAAAESLEALSGTPSEAPVIGVAFTTTVI